MKPHPLAISASLLFAIFLWGGNNAGIKYLVHSWPPIWVGGTRFALAGLLMLVLLRWTDWLGASRPCPAALKRQLWWRGGLSLAVYITIFNSALRFTSASHIALYLGASPVWALIWESRGGLTEHTGRELAKRGLAATLALAGVVVLLWPALRASNSGNSGSWVGEVLGIAASLLWVVYGRDCRAMGAKLSGTEVTAHTMWRAGLLLLPLALIETGGSLPHEAWNPRLLGVQSYCILAGGVTAFALWNSALRHWKTSEVMLFNNLIPASTMIWAHFTLGEPMTSTFWLAMVLVVGGVLIAQMHWTQLWNQVWPPTE